MIKLKAARGRVVITPPEGIMITGDGIDNKSGSVHDDLYCNFLIINDGSTKVCLLGFDLIGLDYVTCNDIKNRIEKTTGIPSTNIIVWATNTHSGPDTRMPVHQKERNSINLYIENISEAVVEEVIKVNDRFEEVSIKTGKKSVSNLSFNKHLLKKDGSVIMNIENSAVNDADNPVGPVDEELITLSLWDKNDKLFALLVNFTLNPAILADHKGLISKDFINYLNKHITDNYGDKALTLFANGAGGNISHIDYQNPDHLKNFEEAERIGKKLGTYVSETIDNSSILDGKIRFTSTNVTFPPRRITKEEKEWADQVLESNKDQGEEMVDGTPDISYAKIIKEMTVSPYKELRTVLQGLAIHNFALVTFPGQFYIESGLEVKEFSPYKNTMVIGMANSQFGCVPQKDAFSNSGYQISISRTNQLDHDAGDILVNLVKDKVIGNLVKQSVKVMERKASDNKYLHKDFHISMNLLMKYINDNFGKNALVDYLEQFSRAYHKPLNDKLKTGDKDALINYLNGIYEKEEWPVTINTNDNIIEITQEACPGISHIVKKGGKPCPYYRETYNTVNKTICENTPFEYSLEYFNEETGACKQLFVKKEEGI